MRLSVPSPLWRGEGGRRPDEGRRWKARSILRAVPSPFRAANHRLGAQALSPSRGRGALLLFLLFQRAPGNGAAIVRDPACNGTVVSGPRIIASRFPGTRLGKRLRLHGASAAEVREVRNTRVARRVFRDAGDRSVYVSRLRKTRRAVLLRRAGVASTGLSIRCRQSLNSQGISASDWRLAVRRDGWPSGQKTPYPGNRVQLRPSGDRIRSPSHDGERDELTPSRRPVLYFRVCPCFQSPSRRRALGAAPQGKGDGSAWRNNSFIPQSLA